MQRSQENRTTEDVATPVTPKIIEHYKDIHLDIDLLFVNKIPFLLTTSRDIDFIHYKALVSKHDKRVCRTNYGQLFLIKGIQGYFRIWRRDFEPLVEWIDMIYK